METCLGINIERKMEPYVYLIRVVGMNAVLVDGVGRVCIIERQALPEQVLVWNGHTFVKDSSVRIQDLPVYRLEGYADVPIRWGT